MGGDGAVQEAREAEVAVMTTTIHLHLMTPGLLDRHTPNHGVLLGNPHRRARSRGDQGSGQVLLLVQRQHTQHRIVGIEHKRSKGRAGLGTTLEKAHHEQLDPRAQTHRQILQAVRDMRALDSDLPAGDEKSHSVRP